LAKKDSYSEFLKEDFSNLFETLELNDRQNHYLKSRWLEQVIWMEGQANRARERYYQLRRNREKLIQFLVDGFGYK
jgi:hypothetical protein